MIIKIYKNYNVNELSIFAEASPDRYKKLCEIVGEFALAVRDVNLGINLPYESDNGCVNVAILNDCKVNIIDCRYF